MGSIIEVLSPGVDSGVCNAFLRGKPAGQLETRNSALRGRFFNPWALQVGARFIILPAMYDSSTQGDVFGQDKDCFPG